MSQQSEETNYKSPDWLAKYEHTRKRGKETSFLSERGREVLIRKANNCLPQANGGTE